MERKGRASPTDELEKGEHRPATEDARLLESEPRAKREHLGTSQLQNKRRGDLSTDDSVGSRQPEEEKSPYAAHCQSDAKIWQLYLKEAEVEDKEVTGIWNDSLDSLLVFAGLFAGVLTAFIIESLKGLKADPQEVLLQRIADLLGNASDSSDSQPFKPDPSSQHVNTLWMISLTLTLLSALGAVLAKGWVAKYNPASYREQLSDACERMLRANRAQEWKLETVITGVPLLIQASLFLFFVGLLIQIIDNDLQIWLTSLILIGLAALLYVIGTVLPWFSPACPFQTPISNFLPGGTSQGRYRDPSTGFMKQYAPSESWTALLLSSPHLVYKFWKTVREKPTQLTLRGQILSWIITNSTKQETIEEAMKAVAGSEPTSDLQGSLLQYGADDVLRRKLRDCVTLTPGLPKTTEDVIKLEYLLYAHLQLEERSPTSKEAENLSDDLLLQDGQALHRWDDFQPHLQALTFSLRVHMLLNRGRDDHEENWEQTVKSLHRLAQEGSPPNIRNILFRATIRGLVNGQKVLRETCGCILSGLILIPDVRESLQDLTKSIRAFAPEDSEKMIPVLHQEFAEFLAQSCVTEKMQEIGIDTLIKITLYRIFPALAGDTVNRIMKRIRNGDGYARYLARLTFEKLADCGAHNAIIQNTSQLISLFEDDDSGVRETAVSVVAEFAKHEGLLETIKPVTLHLINLLKTSDSDVYDAAASAIGQLANHVGSHEIIKSNISLFVNLADNSSSETRKAAVSAIGQFAKHMGFRDAIKPALSKPISLLQDSENGVREAAVHAIREPTNHAEGYETFKPALLQLINLLKDPEEDVRGAAATAIGQFSKHVVFQEVIKPAIIQIINLLKDPSPWVRWLVASAVKELANHETLYEAISLVFPELINQLENASQSSRGTAALVIGHLASHEFREAIKPTVLQLANLLKDSDEDVYRAAADAIVQLANYVEFHEIIKPAILQLINLTKHSDSTFREFAVFQIERVVKHAGFHDEIRPSISHLIGLLEDYDWQVRSAAASTLGHLSKYAEFHETVKPAISQIIDLFKDFEYDVRRAAISAIGKFTNYTEFNEHTKRAVPELVNLLKDPNSIVRTTAASAIGQFAKHLEFRDMIKPATLPLINLLNDSSEDVRSTVSSVIEDLVKYVDSSSTGQFSSIDLSQVLVLADEHRVKGDSARPFIPQLLVSFQSEWSKDQFEGILALSHLAVISQRLPWIFVNIIWRVAKVIPKQELLQLLNVTLDVKTRTALSTSVLHLIENIKEEDPSMRSSIPTVLLKLVEDKDLRDGLKPAVSKLIHLLNDSDWESREAAASTIGGLTHHAEFYEIIKSAVPGIINLLKDFDMDVRKAAVSAIGQCINHVEFREIIKPAIPDIINLFKETYGNVRPAAVSVIGQSAIHALFGDEIKSSTSYLISLLQGDDWTTRMAAASAIEQLSVYAELHGIIKPAVPELINLLKDSDSTVREAAVSAIGQCMSQSGLHEIVKPAISQLINTFEDFASDDSRATASTIGQLATYVELLEVIKPAVPQLINLINDSASEGRKVAASTIGQLASHAEFHEVIKPMISQLISLLKDSDDGVRGTAVSAVVQLANHAEFREIIKPVVPQIILFLENPARSTRQGAFSAIGPLAKHATFHDALKLAVPKLVHLLGELYETASASSAILMLVEDGNLPFLPLLSLDGIISLLKHNMPDIRANVAEFIQSLLKHKHIRTAILESSLRMHLVELLQDRNVAVLKPLMQILTVLVDHGYMSRGIVHVTLNALEHLDDADEDVRRCGASVISAMAPNVRLRSILIEVGTIYASLRHFAHASTQEARMIIERMEYFGVLKEL